MNLCKIGGQAGGAEAERRGGAMVGGVVRASSLIDVLQGMGCAVKLVRPDQRDALGPDLDRDDLQLVIEGDVPPPPRLLAMVKAHRAPIVHALKSPALWSPADWLAHFHERAAILEHDGWLGRAEAEAEALQGCFQIWCGRRCW